MAVTVNSILDRSATILNDAGATRWTVDERLGWLNDGLRDLIVLKPDAKVKSVIVSLAKGAKQVVPADCVVLTGASCETGEAVTPCLRAILDAFMPGWQTKPGEGVQHYMVDPTDPLTYLVYPAQESAGARIELTYSAYPAAAVAGGVLDVQDKYANRLLDYVLFRAYTKDAEFPGAATRATAHYAAFSQ